MKSRHIIFLKKNGRAAASLAVAAILLFIASGCHQAADKQPFSENGIIRTESAPIIRLTRLHFDEKRSEKRPPLDIPLDDSWRSRHVSASVTEEGWLHLEKGEYLHQLNRKIQIDTGLYTEFHVRMAVDSGAFCNLTWASGIEPVMTDNPGVSSPVIADGNPHTYRLILNIPGKTTWAGKVQRILFTPSDENSSITIHFARFVYEPPREAPRCTIANTTHESLFGSQPDWIFKAPGNGILTLWYGLSDRAWKGYYPGKVRFTVTLESSSHGATVLRDQVLDPARHAADRAWQRMTAYLEPYAGEELRLSMKTDPLGGHEGDYAWWGNPILIAGNAPEDTIPVILISCDTLRADHCSVYGYERKTTPFLEQFAHDAVTFDNCITEETWTLPAHTTMLTGLHPNRHHVSANVMLSPEIETLAGCLSSNGYLTAAFTGASGWFMPWRGLARGFDHYDIPAFIRRDIFTTLDLINHWRESHPAANSFLFFHNMDCHVIPDTLQENYPYGPALSQYRYFSRLISPEDPLYIEKSGKRIYGNSFIHAVNEKEIHLHEKTHQFLSALYDDAVRSVDTAIEKLIRDLRMQDRYENALIIITADHGEDLMDHNGYGHGHVYEECAHIPLLVKFPGLLHAGKRFPGQVQLADLLPTVCDALGIQPPPGLDGTSLLEMVEGKSESRTFAHIQRRDRQAVRTNIHKYIYESQPFSRRLFNLIRDPGEKNDIFESNPPVLRQLQEERKRFFKRDTSGWHIAFEACQDTWHGQVSISSDDFIVSREFLNSDRNNDEILVAGSDHKVVADWSRIDVQRLNLMDENIIRDELVLRTASADSPIRLNLTSQTDFMLTIGDGTPEVIREKSLILDPREGEFASPAQQMPSSPGMPAVRIWREESDHPDLNSRQLTEEERESLEALGYLDDL